MEPGCQHVQTEADPHSAGVNWHGHRCPSVLAAGLQDPPQWLQSTVAGDSAVLYMEQCSVCLRLKKHSAGFSSEKPGLQGSLSQYQPEDSDRVKGRSPGSTRWMGCGVKCQSPPGTPTVLIEGYHTAVGHYHDRLLLSIMGNWFYREGLAKA